MKTARRHRGSLSVTLPPGLLGKLAGVEECPQAGIEQAEHRKPRDEGRLEAEHPSCPSGSELGVAHVGAGSGAPLYVTGHAYLAGPTPPEGSTLPAPRDHIRPINRARRSASS